MKDANSKALVIGVAEVVLLILLARGLALSVANHYWIAAQVYLLGALLLLAIAAWQVSGLLSDRSAQKQREDSEKSKEDSVDLGIMTIRRLLQFTAFGMATILIYAIQYSNWNSGAVAKIVGVGLLTAGASLAAGAVLGFIFGVPKSQSAPSTNVSGTSATASSEGQQFGANTNLEQISDWLAKTIVGVSLVELSKLPPLLDKLASYVSAGMGEASPSTKAVSLVIMIYFVSAGFLISYLWSRMELARVFADSMFGKRLDKLEQQSQVDAAAIVAVDRWLHHHPPIGSEEDNARAQLMKNIKGSSDDTKARIFLTAEDYKKNATAYPATDDGKAKIKSASLLTLPIFQALVEADIPQRHHRNRSQYAFSLMTQPQPEWQKALDVLQDAVEFRDKSNEPDWLEYEFARAVCRIRLGQNAKPKPASNIEIKADLKKVDDAKLEQDKLLRLDLDGEVPKWKALNP